MEYSEDSDMPTYDEIIDVAKHIFILATKDMQHSLVEISVEQLRASIRNHLQSVGCDPLDELQLRAFIVGSLLTIQTQIEYSQIGATTALIPASAFNMINKPLTENEIIDFQAIVDMLETKTEPEEKKRWSLLTFIRRIVELGVRQQKR